MPSWKVSDKCNAFRCAIKLINKQNEQLPVILIESSVAHECGLVTRPILLQLAPNKQANNGLSSR